MSRAHDCVCVYACVSTCGYEWVYARVYMCACVCFVWIFLFTWMMRFTSAAVEYCAFCINTVDVLITSYNQMMFYVRFFSRLVKRFLFSFDRESVSCFFSLSRSYLLVPVNFPIDVLVSWLLVSYVDSCFLNCSLAWIFFLLFHLSCFLSVTEKPKVT